MKKIYRKIKITSQKGVTIVELMIYFAILSVLISILTSIFTSALDVQSESEATSSVVGDGNYILARIRQDIHKAESIVVPSSLGETSNNNLQIIINGENFSYSLNANENLTLTNSTGTDNVNNYGTKISNFSVRRLGNPGKVEDTLKIDFRVTGRTQRVSGLEVKNFQTNITLRRK